MNWKTFENKYKKLTEDICFTKDTKIRMILQYLKQYKALEMLFGLA